AVDGIRDDLVTVVQTCALPIYMVFKDVPRMRVAKLKRFMARPTFEDELELHRVDCASSHAMLDNYEFLQRKKEEFANEPIIPPRSEERRVGKEGSTGPVDADRP